MTTFHDGPAKGQTLMLKQAPHFLRVVSSRGQWDALDHPNDAPTADETVVVYKLTGPVGSIHLNAGPRRSGWYSVAAYALSPVQPSEEEARQNDKWRAWRDVQELERCLVINALQEQIVTWSDGTFGRAATVDGKIAHMGREVVELREAPTDPNEMADVVILLLYIAHRAGLTGAMLLSATAAKLEILKGRKWSPPDAEGVCQHLQGGAS